MIMGEKNEAHPEMKPNEVFIGNTAMIGLPLIFEGLKTARMGKQAYDINNKKLPPYYSPIFLGKEDMDEYNRRYMEEIKEVNMKYR